MFRKIIIRLKPILLELLKKIDKIEQDLSFQQRIKIKKTKIIDLPEKLVFFIFVFVSFISVGIKILWIDKSVSFIFLLIRFLSFSVLLFFISEIILKSFKISIAKAFNFDKNTKKNFVIFWTMCILNLVLSLIYTLNGLNFYLLPIVGITILVGILLGNLYGSLFVLLNMFIVGFFYSRGGNEVYLYMLYYLLTSIYALTFVEKIYSRKDIFKAITRCALFSFLLGLLIEIFLGNENIFSLRPSSKLFLVENEINILGLITNNVLSSFLSFSILSVFLSPFESIYQKITNIKLVELSDFNNPLLKRLMSEAPGTYHHSIMVSTLAENVALKLGANSLLCKVASLYHDIGKLIKPEYFVENQSFLQRSQNLDLNTSLSALIIINHVKEGVKLASEYKLDKEIIDIIEQHHGDSIIYGLYDKNLEFNGFNKDLLRYPGVKPQTKEAAIIMICDSCEAACRSIKEPDAQKIKQTVESVINTKFIDGQFDETPLTLRDLYVISNIVTQILISLHHLRTRQERSG